MDYFAAKRTSLLHQLVLLLVGMPRLTFMEYSVPTPSCPPGCQCSKSLSRAVCCLWPAKDVWLAKTGLDSYKRTGYDQFNEHKRQQLSDASEEAVSDLRMQLPVSWCESVPFNERTSHLVCQTVWQEFSIHLTPLSWPPKAGDLRIATETEVGTSISCLQTLRSLTITGTDISSHLRQDANKGSSSDDFEVQAISDLEASDNLVRLTSRELRLALFPLSGQLELQALTVQSTRLQYVEPGFIDQLEAPQLRDIQLRQNRFLTTDGLGTGWLGGLRGLQLLDLSQNRLEAIHLARWGLPSDPISPVIRLDLSDNRITLLESDAFRLVPRLVQLLLAGNQLRELPLEVFRGLTSLRLLDLSRNKLTLPGLLEKPGSSEAAAGGKFATMLPRLRQLRLSGNPLTRAPAKPAWWLSTECPSHLSELHLDEIGDLHLASPILPPIAWPQCPRLMLISLVQPYMKALSCLPRTWLGLDPAGVLGSGEESVMTNRTFQPVGLSVCPIMLSDDARLQSQSSLSDRDHRYVSDEASFRIAETAVDKTTSLRDLKPMPPADAQESDTSSVVGALPHIADYNADGSNPNEAKKSDSSSTGLLALLTNLFPIEPEGPAASVPHDPLAASSGSLSSLGLDNSDSKEAKHSGLNRHQQRRERAFRSLLLLILLSLALTVTLAAVVLLLVTCSRRALNSYARHRHQRSLKSNAAQKTPGMDFLSGSKSPSPTRAGATREMDKTSSCCQVMLLPTQNGVAGMTSLPFLVNRPPTITTSSNKTKPIALRSSNLDRFSAQPPSCYVVSSEDPASHLSSETFRNSSLSLRPQAILSTFTSNSLTSRRREASDVIFPQPLEGQASTSSAGDWSSVGPNHSGARHSLLLPIAACSLSPTLTSLSVGNTCQSAAATPTVGDHLLVRNRSSSRPILSSILNSGAPTFAPLTSEVSTTFLAKSAGAFAITTSHGNSNTNLVSSRSSSSTFANPAFVNPILTQTPYSHHFSPRPGAFQTVAASHIVRSLQASEHSESTSNRPFKVNVPGGESIAGMCNLPAPYGVGACRLAFGPSAVHHHYPHQTALVHFAPGVLNPQTKLFTPAGYATSAAACWSSMSCPSASLSSLGSTGPGVGSSSVIGAGNGAGFCALRRISGTPDRASAIAAWPRKPGVEIGSRLNQSDSIPSPEAGGKMLGSRDFVDASTSMDDSGIVRSDPRSFLPEGRDNLKSAQIGLVLLHSQSALGPLNDTRNQAEGQEEKAEGGSEVGIGEVHGKESFEACTHHPQQNNSTDTLSPSSDKEDTLLGTDSKAHPTFLQPTEIYASDTLTPLTRQMPTGQQIGSSRDLRVGLSPSSDNFSFALPASVADTEPKMSVGGTRLQNSFSCTDDPCFVTTFNRSVSSSLDPHLCQTHRSDKSADRLNHLPCRTGLLNPC